MSSRFCSSIKQQTVNSRPFTIHSHIHLNSISPKRLKRQTKPAIKSNYVRVHSKVCDNAKFPSDVAPPILVAPLPAQPIVSTCTAGRRRQAPARTDNLCLSCNSPVTPLNRPNVGHVADLNLCLRAARRNAGALFASVIESTAP